MSNYLILDEIAKQYREMKLNENVSQIKIFKQFLSNNTLACHFILTSNKDIKNLHLNNILCSLYIFVVNYYAANEDVILNMYDADSLIGYVNNNKFLEDLLIKEDASLIIERIVKNYPDSHILLFCFSKIIEQTNHVNSHEIMKGILFVKSWIDSFVSIKIKNS